MKTKWQLRLQDPSGETRFIRLPSDEAARLAIGASEASDVVLKDPTVPPDVALLWSPEPLPSSDPRSDASPFWIRAKEGAPSLRVGDIVIKESQLPAHLPVQIGETLLCLEPIRAQGALPVFPASSRQWLTTSESGTKLLWLARKAASTPLSIYIGGETGTGKEVIAELIHAWSDRAMGAFIPINCGALPFSLAESELFGHVKGAFTGATHQRPGALLQAHNGTLFLDEIGDLPLDIQVKLLRFLENGEIRPVGADHPTRANVRLLCATHKPLRELVESGKFRRDLYFRLASVIVEIPPLRDRPDDIEHLAHRFANELGRTLSPRAMLRLKAHSWPGNVRELRHTVERAAGMSGPFHTTLGEEQFDFLMESDGSTIETLSEVTLSTPILTLNEMERVMLTKALRLSNGNRAAAARILGVARSTLFEMLKRHRIVGPRKRVIDFEVRGFT